MRLRYSREVLIIKKNYPKHYFRIEKIDVKRKVKRTYKNGRVFDPVLQKRKENRENGRLLNHVLIFIMSLGVELVI